MLEGVMGIYGFRVFVLVVTREQGNMFYKDCVGNIGIIFPYSLLRTNNLRVFGAMYGCIGTYNV